MAWQLHSRQKRGIKYQDDISSQKFALDTTLAPLHYESVLDSGEFTAPIDCTPVRVQNAQLDGWRVTANGFHYALGQPAGKSDGWVGFGGRQGQNWLQFRLLRLGYLRWNNRAWTDIGGAPTYSRTNLASEVRSWTVPATGETLPIESIATWSGLWATPGGGDVSVSWRVNGDQLKEEVTLNQAGREWIATNRPPTTPVSQTWFGFVFQLDWADVPRIVKNAILQDREGDFADDGQPVELRDSLDRLLGFLPIDDVIVRDATGDELARTPLQKRFWKDGDGNYYLLVGVRCDTLAGLPAGDLVFDPTIDNQVGASADDALQASDGTVTLTGVSIGMFGAQHGGFRFLNIAIPAGSTIDTCKIDLLLYNTSVDSPNNGVVKIELGDAAEIAAETNNLTNRTYASTSVTATGTDIGTGWWSVQGTPPELKTILQEVIDHASWADGNDILVKINGADSFGARSYDQNTANAAKLHIEYTAGGAASIITQAMHYYRRRRI